MATVTETTAKISLRKTKNLGYHYPGTLPSAALRTLPQKKMSRQFEVAIIIGPSHHAFRVTLSAEEGNDDDSGCFFSRKVPNHNWEVKAYCVHRFHIFLPRACFK
jgi:hypothetical protein